MNGELTIRKMKSIDLGFVFACLVGASLVLSCAGAADLDQSVALDNGVRLSPFAETATGTISSNSLRLTRDGNRFTVSFTAPHDGVFRFGFALEAPSLTALSGSKDSYASASLNLPQTLRYPFDWNDHKSKNVLQRPRLMFPGVEAGGHLFVVDTYEMTAIVFEKANEKSVRALVLKHRTFNDGGDLATADLKMRAGEADRMELVTFASIAEANVSRFGRSPIMKGQMTAISYRGWPGSPFTVEQYRPLAGGLAGVYDYVIIREVENHNWIPPLFHQRGMKVIAYQFLGALRRLSAQVTGDTEKTIGLRAADGTRYTAPNAPDGAWLLCDIRQPETRRLFVERARNAIESGFDGVFLDGYFFWRDASGRIGGNVPCATESLARARWELLHETKEAIRQANPKAILGVSGNQYYDLLGEADFIVKERVYFNWADEFASQIAQRTTYIGQDIDASFEMNDRAFVAHNVCYGAKGLSPISVRSARHFVCQPTGFAYVEPGDFFPGQQEFWLQTVVDIADKDGLYIRRIEPSTCLVNFEGRTTIWAKEACQVEFSVPTWVIAESGSVPNASVRDLSLKPNRRYQLCSILPVEVHPGKLYIVDAKPSNAAITCTAPDRIRANVACEVEFSHPIDVLDFRGRVLKTNSFKLKLEAGVEYELHQPEAPSAKRNAHKINRQD